MRSPDNLENQGAYEKKGCSECIDKVGCVSCHEPFHSFMLTSNEGLEQAQSEVAPAYLEAAPGTESLYQKHGFEVVDSMTVDLKDAGIDMAMTLLKMMAKP